MTLTEQAIQRILGFTTKKYEAWFKLLNESAPDKFAHVKTPHKATYIKHQKFAIIYSSNGYNEKRFQIIGPWCIMTSYKCKSLILLYRIGPRPRSETLPRWWQQSPCRILPVWWGRRWSAPDWGSDSAEPDRRSSIPLSSSYKRRSSPEKKRWVMDR